ncbi:MAG: glycosyltransferase family 4 protein [Deltaproteobacteria bacterium]|nr:glycosyltransferase family 4 protein [Deltaproteobacteria bacterium]
MRDARGTIVILSQVFVPDPAAAGQHLADVARELVRRGWRVRVLTAARGYDDPTARYPSHEVLDGVEVQRLSLSSFGKGSLRARLAGGALFTAQALVRALAVPGLRGVLVSTSPPFCGAAGAMLSVLRRAPLKYWLMDLNPDQAVALGLMDEHSLPVRLFDALNTFTLRRAADVVLMDRFMRDRVARKHAVDGRFTILPPWPMHPPAANLPHADNPFRAREGLQGKFVVMYSGNHGPAHPLTTVLDAAARLAEDSRFVFLFVGGGTGKHEVEERIRRGARNVRSLPFQPLGDLRASLSAADVHVVSMAAGVVGLVHPSKAYGAMAVSRPLLVLGPAPNPVADLMDAHGMGRRVEHGDVDGAVAALRELADLPEAQRAELGARAAALVAGELGREALCARFCDVVERGLVR